ncbi:MAG: hypothetical protein GY756_00030, partial [bacterium]|nr:hypothetical protein [bacterium]
MIKKLFIVFIITLFFPYITFADTSEDSLKLISPRFERIQKSDYILEFMTAYFYKSQDIMEQIVNPAVDHSSTHYFINQIYLSYGLTDSMACYMKTPFVYINDQRSTSSERTASDFGDLSAGITYQNNLDTGLLILDLSYTAPTGK